MFFPSLQSTKFPWHILVSAMVHQIQASLTEQKLIKVLNKVKNHMQEFKTETLLKKRKKKSNLRTLKNENKSKNWPALRICRVVWIELIEKLPHIIDQLQQITSFACPDDAETMEVMDFQTKLSHLYMPRNCKSLNLQD